jgi:predicted molibdopterin-dependent oxidoreductase YjgC
LVARRIARLTVNGREVVAPANQVLIHVLRDRGVRIPTLCHDDRLTPYGGCRLCVVARRDEPSGLIPACSTPVEEGMVIETDSTDVIASRRRQLQLLLLDHRLECPVCSKSGDCRLQDLLYEIGVPDEDLPFDAARSSRDERSPVIIRDPEKCVLCGRCVRLCDEVQGVGAIGLVDRGLGVHVTTFQDRPLDCEFCGQCVNACPVGALIARPYTASAPAWLRTSVATTCSFCSCGCELTVEADEGHVQRVTGRTDSSPNHGKLCAKGWLGLDVLSSSERLTTPMVRRSGRLEEASWEEALDAAAAGLREARTRGRPVVGVASGRLSCEDGYLFQRFLRGVLGSPHVALAPTGGVKALVDGLGCVLTRSRSTGTLEDLASADVVLVLRGDPTRTHPLVKTELVQGVRQRGQKLALINCLSGGLERHASLHFELEPGTEELLLWGLALRLLQLRPILERRLRECPGFGEWRQSLADHTEHVVCTATGAPRARFQELVQMLLAARRPVIVVVTALGIPGDEVEVARGAAQLAALMPGGQKVLVLSERANVQGLIDVGLHPTLLPGHRPAADPVFRTEIGRLLGEAPPSARGWTTRGAFTAAARGEVGAAILAGVDPLRAFPRAYRPAEALAGAGFLVAMDGFSTETTRQADVVFPVAILAEREGTLVGADGVRRPLRRVVPPPAALPGDGELLVELARRLGGNLPIDGALERELTTVVPWPFEDDELRRFVPVPPPAARAGWRGILLDPSPQLFHSGSVTAHSRQLRELAPTVAVRIHPDDAREFGVRGGEVVTISGAGRELMLRARIDRTVRTGSVVVPWSGGRDSASELMIEDGRPVVVEVRKSQ